MEVVIPLTGADTLVVVFTPALLIETRVLDKSLLGVVHSNVVVPSAKIEAVLDVPSSPEGVREVVTEILVFLLFVDVTVVEEDLSALFVTVFTLLSAFSVVVEEERVCLLALTVDEYPEMPSAPTKTVYTESSANLVTFVSSNVVAVSFFFVIVVK